MTQRVEVAACVLLAVALAPLTGCSPTSLILPVFYELRGARGQIDFVRDIPPAELERFRSVRFEPASTSVGTRLTPPELLRSYDSAARTLEQGELRGKYPGGEPTLAVATEFLYFKSKGLFGEAEVLARMRFNHGERMVGDAIVRVGSRSFHKGGTQALADATAKTVGKYLMTGAEEEEKREERRKRSSASKDGD